MSADLAARLRGLAQDHHDGRLTLAAYRALRAPLLDSLVASVPTSVDMDATQPRAVARPAQPPAPEPSSTSEPKKPLPVGVITSVVGLLAIGAFMLWFLLGREAPEGEDTGRRPVASASNEVESIIAPFVERGDWSDARLAGLNASLLELSGPQREAVAREQWFHRFVDELRGRLKEQQALATHPLTPENSALAALAVTVGLDLNSPDAAIRIAPVHGGAGHHASGSRPSKPHASTGETAAQPETVAQEPGPRLSETEEARSPVQREPPAERTRDAAERPGEVTRLASAEVAATTSMPAAPAPAQTASQTPSPANSQAISQAASLAARDSACRIELIRSRRPLCQDALPFGEGPLLALVPAGEFEMGSTAAEAEQPVHRVTLAKPFAISVNEISQGEFQLFCAQTRRTCPPQPWTGEDLPVVNVTWSEAREYTQWLSSVTGHRYRLPTEAQWEYAARAGQTGLFPGGDALSPTDAHFSLGATQAGPASRSQKFKANGFRLLHTLGNVREWVEDAWSASYANAPSDGSAVKTGTGEPARVVRGGSYADGPARIRLSLRERLPEDSRDAFTGFRVVRELP